MTYVEKSKRGKFTAECKERKRDTRQSGMVGGKAWHKFVEKKGRMRFDPILHRKGMVPIAGWDEEKGKERLKEHHRWKPKKPVVKKKHRIEPRCTKSIIRLLQ